MWHCLGSACEVKFINLLWIHICTMSLLERALWSSGMSDSPSFLACYEIPNAVILSMFSTFWFYNSLYLSIWLFIRNFELKINNKVLEFTCYEIHSTLWTLIYTLPKLMKELQESKLIVYSTTKFRLKRWRSFDAIQNDRGKGISIWVRNWEWLERGERFARLDTRMGEGYVRTNRVEGGP